MDRGVVADQTRELSAGNAVFRRHYPGDSRRGQLVHTFYGGAHLFKANTVERLGALARKSLEDYAPSRSKLYGRW